MDAKSHGSKNKPFLFSQVLNVGLITSAMESQKHSPKSFSLLRFCWYENEPSASFKQSILLLMTIHFVSKTISIREYANQTNSSCHKWVNMSNKSVTRQIDEWSEVHIFMAVVHQHQLFLHSTLPSYLTRKRSRVQMWGANGEHHSYAT